MGPLLLADISLKIFLDPPVMLSKQLLEDNCENRLNPGLTAFRQQSWTKPNLLGQPATLPGHLRVKSQAVPSHTRTLQQLSIYHHSAIRARNKARNTKICVLGGGAGNGISNKLKRLDNSSLLFPFFFFLVTKLSTYTVQEWGTYYTHGHAQAAG